MEVREKMKQHVMLRNLLQIKGMDVRVADRVQSCQASKEPMVAPQPLQAKDTWQVAPDDTSQAREEKQQSEASELLEERFREEWSRVDNITVKNRKIATI